MHGTAGAFAYVPRCEVPAAAGGCRCRGAPARVVGVGGDIPELLGVIYHVDGTVTVGAGAAWELYGGGEGGGSVWKENVPQQEDRRTVSNSVMQ